MRLPIRAALANLADGLKIRFSFRTDSMLVTGLTGEGDDGTDGAARGVDMGKIR